MSIVAIPSTFYKEHQGLDYLSKTFESSVRHAPGDVKRRTISEENYLRQRANEEKYPKTPWGRKYSYGGMGVVQLPSDHRPKGEPPLRVQKGTHHFISGANTHPSDVTLQQFYSITPTKKSDVRSTDELVESPNKVDLTRQQIDLKFPAEHPYASHIPKTSMFPPYESPHCVNNYEHAQSRTFSSETPASAPEQTVLNKTRGSAGRHEVISIPLDSQNKPMTWPCGPTYFQLLKGENRERQVYYPIPSKLLDPNLAYSRGISEGTTRALKELRLSQWKTTYQKDFNRTPIQPINVDSVTTIRQITSGPNAEVPTNLMNSTNKSNNKNDNNSVDELTGEESRKERQVHFASMTKPDNMVKSSMVERAENLNKSRTFPHSAFKNSRPHTSVLLRPEKDLTNYNRVRSAELDRQACDINDYQQSWSATDIRRKFNATHDDDDVPDLRRKPDLRITTNERRHRIPEAGNVGSYLFHGQYIPEKIPYST